MLKNRLEQFKKRQREDALAAEAELARRPVGEKRPEAYGGDIVADAGDAYDSEEGEGEGHEVEEDDWVEEYDPEMSPEPVDMRYLPLEERRLPIFTPEGVQRDVVSRTLPSSAAITLEGVLTPSTAQSQTCSPRLGPHSSKPSASQTGRRWRKRCERGQQQYYHAADGVAAVGGGPRG